MMNIQNMGPREINMRQEAMARRERLFNFKPKPVEREKVYSQISTPYSDHVRLWRWYLENKFRIDAIIEGARVEPFIYFGGFDEKNYVDSRDAQPIRRPIGDIVQEVIDEFGKDLSFEDIKSERRDWSVVGVRQLAIWAVKKERSGITFARMGDWFKRHHSTILVTIKKLDEIASEIGSKDPADIYTELCRRRPRFVPSGQRKSDAWRDV